MSGPFLTPERLAELRAAVDAGEIRLEVWQRPIVDDLLDDAEQRRRSSDQVDAIGLAALTTDAPDAAFARYRAIARGEGLDRGAEQLAELEIAVDAFRAELALMRRQRPPRESVAEPEHDHAFARRQLLAEIRRQRRIAAHEAAAIRERSVAGKIREAARATLYTANRTAAALERVVDVLNRTEAP